MFADITLSMPHQLNLVLPLAVALLDLFVKSSLLIAVIAWLQFAFRPVLSARARHLLWVYAIGSVLMLPILPLLGSLASGPVRSAPEPYHYRPVLELVNLTAIVEPAAQSAGNAVASSSADSTGPAAALPLILLAFYAVPCLLLLGRLFYSVLLVRRLQRTGLAKHDLDWVIRINQLKQRFGIDRPVTVKFSGHVRAPISYGLLSPEIIFPDSARKWPARVFESTLLHELAHIQRFDWLTSALSYTVCSLLWFNPLLWMAWRRLNAEAESACDRAVLHTGISNADYAEDLLSVTRFCKTSQQAPAAVSHGENTLLLQSALGMGTLKQRIESLVNRDSEPNTHSLIANGAMLVGASALMVMFSVCSIVTAEALPPVDLHDGLSVSELWSEYRRNAEQATHGASLSSRGGDSESALLEVEQIAIAPPDAMPEIQGDFLPLRRTIKVSVGSGNPPPRPVLNVSLKSLSEALMQSVSGQPPVVIEATEQHIASMSKSQLRDEIERVASEYFSRLNASIEDRSLHIECVSYRKLGSFIPIRVCEPRFITAARGEALRSSMIMQTSLIQQDLFVIIRDDVATLTSKVVSALESDPELRRLHGYLSVLLELDA